MGSYLGLGGKGWFLRSGMDLCLWGQAGNRWASAQASVGLGSTYQITGLGLQLGLSHFARNWSQGSGWWAWGLRSGLGSGIRLGSRVKARGLWAKPISKAELDS